MSQNEHTPGLQKIIFLEYARFGQILQNCVVHQVSGIMCLIVFLAFTLISPIQTLFPVVPTRSVFWHATQFQQNEHTPETQVPWIQIVKFTAQSKF